MSLMCIFTCCVIYGFIIAFYKSNKKNCILSAFVRKKYQNILKDVLLTVFNCIERFILLLLS